MSTENKHKKHRKPVTVVKMSKKYGFVVCGSLDFRISIWDIIR